MAEEGSTSPIHRLSNVFQLLPRLTPRSPTSPTSNEKHSTDLERNVDVAADSGLMSAGGDSIREDDLERRRDVRTLPPWIHSLAHGENATQMSEVSYALPNVPFPAHPPHHPFVPTQKPGPEAGHGKLTDQGRTREPTFIRSPLALAAPRWQTFTNRAHPTKVLDDRGELVDDEWYKENIGDLHSPWNADAERDEADKDERLWLFSDNKRIATIQKYQRVLLRNAFVPLIIRMTVLLFVLCALGLGVTIYQGSRHLNDSASAASGGSLYGVSGKSACKQQTSTYMAFVVDSVAVVYLLYITWEEYTSKPLGMRRSRDKVRLLFLDLVFIVFSAANLSLAFNTLTDQEWACHSPAASSGRAELFAAETTCIQNSSLCKRQMALCGVLLIALVAWFLTFATSVLRVVERISH